MKKNFKTTLNRYIHFYKYDLLLIGLLQHLFIGIIVWDLDFYIKYIWPINMIILVVFSMGVFIDKELWKKNIKIILSILVIGFPLALWFNVESTSIFMSWLNTIYLLFFLFTFYELFRFLVKPNYINIDLITAAACGFLLLIEIATFCFQYLYYENPNCFVGVHHDNQADIFSSFVYFSSVTLTSIGFGDISPKLHYTKLLTSVFGIIGQFYSVILVGILLSKFNFNKDK